MRLFFLVLSYQILDAQTKLRCMATNLKGERTRATHITTTLQPPATTNHLATFTTGTPNGKFHPEVETEGVTEKYIRSHDSPKNKIFIPIGTETNGKWSKKDAAIIVGVIFGCFVGLPVIAMAVACCITALRVRAGRRPVYGTTWLMPPSYRQSQQQQHTNRGEEPDEYVPTYSEQPNENVDLGYYDERGEFHLSGQDNEYPSPKTGHEEDENMNWVRTYDDTLVNSAIQDKESSDGRDVSLITVPDHADTIEHQRDHAAALKPNVPSADLG